MIRRVAVLLSVAASLVFAGDAHYYWKATPAGDSAELVTLFCRSCETAAETNGDIPLIAVMRDNLGDQDKANDRVTDVWLLTYTRTSWGRHALSAVPFFYWKVGEGSSKVSKRDAKPLMNVAEPRHSMVSSVARKVVQITVLDPISTGVRSSTRAYQNNKTDHERLHLEEAESYLQAAPADDDGRGLTERELTTVIARLELRKRILGGLVNENRAADLGQTHLFEAEQTRIRNWELLRQCADKTGLFFEAVDVAGAKGEYAILWYPEQWNAPAAGVEIGPVWKLLNLKDPVQEQDKLAAQPWYERTVGGATRRVKPLGIYSLSYPRNPLLLADFLDNGHLRRHELTQRAINEVTSGVIGVSRITNWYYFVGADLYDFYMSRQGKAMNRVERLDCYSKFRVALALDRSLDAPLRAAIQKKIDSLAVNPLETSPASEMKAAVQRYDLLQEASGPKGALESRIEKERRRELAAFEATQQQRVRADVFHYLTFGAYTKRAPADAGSLAQLDRNRRAQYYLNFLDGVSAAGTNPEVAYNKSLITGAVSELRALIPQINSPEISERGQRVIDKVLKLSEDPGAQVADLASGAAGSR